MRLSRLRDQSSWTVSAFGPPLALMGACLLAFGLTIPWLGLYADDWPFVYVNHLAGLRGVVEFISWVRPVAAWVFASAAALVGTHFWLVHVLLLLLRWLSAVLLWRVLRRAWPAQPLPALWAALLFAVYPAFKQQPLALEYVPHFVALALLFGSLEISLRLAQDPPLPRKQFYALAAAAWLGSFQVFILEYFVGLEALRPALLWIVLARCMDRRAALKRTIKLWLPFLPVLAGFLYWRVFVVGFPSYQPELIDSLGQSPLAAAGQLAVTVVKDLWTAGLAVWLQIFRLPAGGRTLLAWIGVVGLALAASGAYLALAALRRPSPAEQADRSRWPMEFAGVGLFAMLASGWPFWITRIPLSLDFPWDRTSLAFMVGACLLAAGLLGLAARLPGRALTASLVAAVLLGFSVGLHFLNSNTFRKEWSTLTRFYWQLSWRAPGLAPGAAIVLDQPPFNYHVDKFLSPLVNWTYAPDWQPGPGGDLNTPYILLDFHKLWGKTLPPRPGAETIRSGYGTIKFEGDTNRILVVVYDPPGCLRILTPAEETHLLISPELKETLPLTNLGLIDPSTANPARPPDFLGPEPAQDWCYYFEKASLAMQQNDAQAAADLGDRAAGQGLAAQQPSEYLVFVDAYARIGRWEDARRLAAKTAQVNDFYRNATCATLERIGSEADASGGQMAEEAKAVIAETGCP